MRVYPFIEAEKAGRRNVSRACALLKVSRAAFYQHLSGPSRHDQDDADLAVHIAVVHEESKGRYGAPRVHAELARRAVVEYIAWYNSTRLHSTLGYQSPAQFEQQNKTRKIA